MVTRYEKRLSGPIIDRIDLHIEVPRVEYAKLVSSEPAEASGVVRERVLAARERQWRRFAETPGVMCNSEMRLADLREWCELDKAPSDLLRAALHPTIKS